MGMPFFSIWLFQSTNTCLRSTRRTANTWTARSSNATGASTTTPAYRARQERPFITTGKTGASTRSPHSGFEYRLHVSGFPTCRRYSNPECGERVDAPVFPVVIKGRSCRALYAGVVVLAPVAFDDLAVHVFAVRLVLRRQVFVD